MSNWQIIAEDRQTCSVPATAGNYASEVVQLGVTQVGMEDLSIIGVTGMLEAGSVPGVTLELWVRRARGGDSKVPSDMTAQDYTNSGLSTLSSPGVVSWVLGGGIRAAQLRVKSGGTPGLAHISGWAT